MLVLTRKAGEEFYIGNDIRIVLIETERGKARIGIDAPKDVEILRKELKDRITNGNSTEPQ